MLRVQTVSFLLFLREKCFDDFFCFAVPIRVASVSFLNSFAIAFCFWIYFPFIGEENSILLPDLFFQDAIFWRICKWPRNEGAKLWLRLAEPAEDSEGFVLRKREGTIRDGVME